MRRLPEGYREIKRIDLMKNRREAIMVNALAFAIAIGMGVLGFALCPPFSGSLGIHTILNTLLFLVSVLLYTVLHELIHGVFMKSFSGVKPRYGFTGLYAYASSEALFGRRQYLIIAFAPVVILGAILAALNISFYETYFWFFYIIQIVNISGAAGDIYVGYQIGRLHPGILILDTGTGMTLYSNRY
ncbi:MAG: DUF3267 domain-containing protein [Candidatus Pacebacteria bacterium]|nr:DUF3267 domain-containing protein [Candidatus Paceibacterota bacterium]